MGENKPDRAEYERQSSMDHWWPRLQNADVMLPETVRVEITDESTFQGDLPMPVPDWDELRAAIDRVDGPPAFFRSDLTSTKHHMEQGSRIIDTGNLEQYVAGVVEQHHMAMMMPMPSTYYVREWLDLYHNYRSFSNGLTPIAAEIRCFLLDGELYDHGFYWPKDAVWEHSVTEENWKELHDEVKEVAFEPNRINALEKYANSVADVFDTGYWSIDFALTESDQWYAIDMARGEVSWHPNNVTVPESVDR